MLRSHSHAQRIPHHPHMIRALRCNSLKTSPYGARSANCFYCIGMFYQRSDPSGHGTYNEYPLDQCAHHSEASATIIVCKTSKAFEPAANGYGQEVTAKTVCVYLLCWGYVFGARRNKFSYKVKYCLKAVLKKAGACRLPS